MRFNPLTPKIETLAQKPLFWFDFRRLSQKNWINSSYILDYNDIVRTKVELELSGNYIFENIQYVNILFDKSKGMFSRFMLWVANERTP